MPRKFWRGAVLALAMAACAPARPARSYLPMAAPFDGVRVTVSVKDGRVRVESEGGVASVDFVGVAAHVRLPGGQRLSVEFNARSSAFQVEILDDADVPVDVAVGQAVVHSTRGDAFEARIAGENVEIVVTRGLVRVIGPDKLSEEVGQGSQITVAGAAKGAIQGVPPPAPVAPIGPKGPLREPRRPPILDRTDIAPAP